MMARLPASSRHENMMKDAAQIVKIVAAIGKGR
jgi:hypothetical protein